MKLEVKRADHVVPTYSLTGDLLSYLRCRLQYRYHNGSALPPSRPVQLWFGEFLHGTLEMCYRFWSEEQKAGRTPPAFPWPCTKQEWGQPAPTWQNHDIGKFAATIESALRQQGKQARSSDARDSAYVRVNLAVNELGPHLFPLIESAERKVIGTRPVPASKVQLRCSNYEVHGVIDVLTHVTLSNAPQSNLIRSAVQAACPGLQGTFEVVVDYKGQRRPLEGDDYWKQGDWQVQTYAWLRQKQADALPVAAGILIYINELTPGNEEMTALHTAVLARDKGKQPNTDVMPAPGSSDEQIIRMWRSGHSSGQLSLDFRLRRTIRVIKIDDVSIQRALKEFDDVVRRAEEDIVEEANGVDILKSWSPTCKDDNTCNACDFRHFCPNPADAGANYKIKSPDAP